MFEKLLAEPLWRTTAIWMLTAYVFMLRYGVLAWPHVWSAAWCVFRVPSECLPIVTVVGDCHSGPAQANKAELHVGVDETVLCLRRRKNM